MMNEKITAGFVGFGEVNTPKKIIERKCKQSVDFLSSLGITVKSTAMVSDDPEGTQAKRAAEELKNMDFDFLVVCIAGWIPSWAVIKTIEPFKQHPILMWGLTGDRIGDRFVTTAAQAGTTALRKTIEDMGFRFKYIVNRLGKEVASEQIFSFARAAHAVGKLRNATIGMAGYRDMRLYGTIYDAVSLRKSLGIEIEHFDLLEIAGYMEEVSEKDIDISTRYILKNWDFVRQPKKETLRNTVKLYLAFKRKIEERRYDAISYSDVDGIKKLFRFAPAGALSLLHDKMRICSIPENDSMGAVTQLITSFLTGGTAAYLEFYEFTETGALMGVPDYVPGDIVNGRVTVMPNSFGDFGEGILNISKLKTGPVTLARLANKGSDYFCHLMTGVAKTPLKWEEAGWSPPAPILPSLEIDFDGDTEKFIQNVLSQHYIISYGNNLQLYKDLCSFLNIRIILS
jgi:L-fucose isomerase-like protein